MILTGLVGLAVYAVLTALGDGRHHVPVFLAWIGVAWGGYAWAAQSLLKVFWKRTAAEAETPSASVRQRQAIFILFFALLYRAILLPTLPWLSDDVYRYLWDGRVLLNGINPYQWPPNAPELAGLRDQRVYPLVNHPEVGTIYPPLLQGLFFFGQLLGGTALSLKLIWLFIDAALLRVLYRVLQKRKDDPRRVLLYAWNPLAILEVCGSGHADGLLGLIILVAVFTLAIGRSRTSALAMGAGFLVKFVSVLLLPFAWMVNRRRFGESLLIFALVVIIGYAPFWNAGSNMLSGFLTYTAKWRANDGIFSLIYYPVEKLLPEAMVVRLMFEPGWALDEPTLASRRIDLALMITKLITSMLFLAWMALLFRRFRQSRDEGERWGRLAVALLAGLLLLSPTFHPWYMLWLLPLLAVWPNRALLMLSGTALLSYWSLQNYVATGIWQESAAVKWLEFTPVFAVMIYDYKKSLDKGKHLV